MAGDRRDVLDVELRQPLGGDAVHGSHDRAVPVRVLEVLVDPLEVGVPALDVARQVLVRELARRQHHLPVLPVDDVAVVVDVDEPVVGPDLLQLGEGEEQRRVVPEPHVPERRRVAGQVGGGQGLPGREVALLDAVERERLPRQVDVVGDVGALRDQGVRSDAQALHQRREHPEAADPPGDQHDEAGQDRAGAAPEHVDERGEPAEHRRGPPATRGPAASRARPCRSRRGRHRAASTGGCSGRARNRSPWRRGGAPASPRRCARARAVITGPRAVRTRTRPRK